MRIFRTCLPLLFLAAASACSSSSEPVPMPATADANDAAAFDRFIAAHPTPDEFRARYPKVLLVLPGDISTRELRMDRSRYFAELDEQQRITGGKFQ